MSLPVRDDLAAWSAVLDDLERYVEQAERLVSQQDAPALPPWTIPAVSGAMPADLVPRARKLFERQQRALAATATALATNREQNRLVGRIAESAAEPGAAYVDVTA